MKVFKALTLCVLLALFKVATGSSDQTTDERLQAPDQPPSSELSQADLGTDSAEAVTDGQRHLPPGHTSSSDLQADSSGREPHHTATAPEQRHKYDKVASYFRTCSDLEADTGAVELTTGTANFLGAIECDSERVRSIACFETGFCPALLTSS